MKLKFAALLVLENFFTHLKFDIVLIFVVKWDALGPVRTLLITPFSRGTLPCMSVGSWVTSGRTRVLEVLFCAHSPFCGRGEPVTAAGEEEDYVKDAREEGKSWSKTTCLTASLAPACLAAWLARASVTFCCCGYGE